MCASSVGLCRVVWQRPRLAVTIDLFTFYFLLAYSTHDQQRALVFHQAQEMLYGSHNRLFQLGVRPATRFLGQAATEALKIWVQWEKKHRERLAEQSDIELFFDPEQELHDYSAEIATLLSGLASTLDINQHLRRR